MTRTRRASVVQGAALPAWLDSLIFPVTESGCWLWTGYITPTGYGLINYRGATNMAHRLVYEAQRGPVTQGLQLDHLCRVRCCVNPNHLEQVSRRVNILRGTSPQAMNARKEFCVRGHRFDLDYVRPTDGKRERRCSQCIAFHSQRWIDKRVQQARERSSP